MTSAVKFDVPAGACDSHIHVYGEPGRYPYQSVDGKDLPHTFLDDYLAIRDRLGLGRTVVIQTPYYGTDNACAVTRCGGRGDGRRVFWGACGGTGCRRSVSSCN